MRNTAAAKTVVADWTPTLQRNANQSDDLDSLVVKILIPRVKNAEHPEGRFVEPGTRKGREQPQVTRLKITPSFLANKGDRKVKNSGYAPNTLSFAGK